MRSLEDAVHQALTLALHQGLTPSEIRGAVAHWLAAPPPTRVVVVDTNLETAELLVHEIRERIDVPVSWCTLEAAARDPGPLASALAVTWPFHLETLQNATGIPNVAVLTLRIGDTRVLRAVPRGGLILVISHSPRVLRYALGLLGGVRGDDVTIRCYRLADRSQWQDLLGTADLIYVDALSAGPVRSLRARGTREFRLVTEASHADIRQRMALPAPPRAAREAGRTGRTRTGDADGLRRSGLP
jgi:hypothetical protein